MIRVGREAKGLTQQSLGDMFGVGQPTVCQWERNRARPSVTTLDGLSRLFVLDLGDLTRAAGAPLEYPRGGEPPT